MAVRNFNLSWMRQYRADTNSYVGSNSPIRVGGNQRYHSYLGFPTAVRSALQESSTTPQLRLKIFVTDATPEWSLGRHKLAGSAEPTFTTMPWYNYLRAVQGQGTGWVTINLTNDFMNDYRNGTYQGMVLYSGAGSSWYGEASNSGSNRAVLEVTGTWNSPPNRPTVTQPVSSTVASQSVLARWTSGGDPDGDALRFQVGVRGGASSSGYNYLPLTGLGATQLTVDTSNLTEGPNAQIAVRAYDGEFYSPWAYSPSFTISHNQAPTQPSQLSPNNGAIRNREEVIRFSWRHNDDGPQAGYRLAWRTVASNGTRGVWNYRPSSTGFQNTTNQFYDYPANTFPNSDIEWTVMTRDQQGLSSPYAPYTIFKARNATNTPTIIRPTNGGTLSETKVTVEWSSLNQQDYNLILKDSNGSVLWSISTAGNAKLVEIPIDLSNNASYSVELRVRDTVNQIWSDYEVHTFTTAFEPPEQPVMVDYEELGEGIVSVFYSALEGNIFSRLMIGEGKMNERVQMYNGATSEDIDLLGVHEVTLRGQNKGIELNYGLDYTNLSAGLAYRLQAQFNVQGGRLELTAFDANDNQLQTASTASTSASSPTGLGQVNLTIPANTVRLRARIFTTTNNVNEVNISGLSLRVTNVARATDTIDIYRRPYSELGGQPWVKIARDLDPVGGFIDYTPASGTLYEYRVRAKATNNTNNPSQPMFVTINFDNALIQEVSNMQAIHTMTLTTQRDIDLEIDGQTNTFAGRRLPVREFGEHESRAIDVTWEVDSYGEVESLERMVQRRDTLLYRDKNGRRHFVTTDKVTVKDKQIYGFEITMTLIETDHIEDVDLQDEELI